MEVADVLEWHGVSTPLRRPVMVIALTGWFDIAGVATSALRFLTEANDAELIATIDPDPFYDFTQVRPEARFDDDGEREIVWPTNDVVAIRFPNAVRALDAVPHTRAPIVVGSSFDPDLARGLGLSKPSYQGMTGVVGVLQTECEKEDLPAVSLRVGVPYYLDYSQHPQSAAALLQHLGHVLGVPTGVADLNEEIERWRGLHDEAMRSDPDLAGRVRALEIGYDQMTEAAIPSADDLAEQFQKFLDDQP
ncbi:MAG: PAC2 family protein [Actinobacteria bacterium]|nr:PAC2 family protein [Actinomycetota bacterium]